MPVAEDIVARVEHISTVNEVAQTDHVVSLLPNGTGLLPIVLEQIELSEVS
jgi:hypothetical protein